MLLFFCSKQAGRSAWDGNNGLHLRRRHTAPLNNSCVNRVPTVPGAVQHFAEPEKWYLFGHPRTSAMVPCAGFGTRSIPDHHGGSLSGVGEIQEHFKRALQNRRLHRTYLKSSIMRREFITQESQTHPFTIRKQAVISYGRFPEREKYAAYVYFKMLSLPASIARSLSFTYCLHERQINEDLL